MEERRKKKLIDILYFELFEIYLQESAFSFSSPFFGRDITLIKIYFIFFFLIDVSISGIIRASVLALNQD